VAISTKSKSRRTPLYFYNERVRDMHLLYLKCQQLFCIAPAEIYPGKGQCPVKNHEPKGHPFHPVKLCWKEPIWVNKITLELQIVQRGIHNPYAIIASVNDIQLQARFFTSRPGPVVQGRVGKRRIHNQLSNLIFCAMIVVDDLFMAEEFFLNG
jgi:hypothetical protein